LGKPHPEKTKELIGGRIFIWKQTPTLWGIGSNRYNSYFLIKDRLSKSRWGEVRWGEVRWGEVRWGEVRWGEVRWGEVRLYYVMLG
jgi:hypothetical protein